MLKKNILYYGKEEPLPERIPLKAGPLNLFFENGDLVYIKFGTIEVIRRIYVAIRDHNWGTIPPFYSNFQIEKNKDSFHITLTTENRQGQIDFVWEASITGNEQGIITYSMSGLARSTFLRNRIGFCLLHPGKAAGALCKIEHIDGEIEEANLPMMISPQQPLPSFDEIRAIAHQVLPGTWMDVRFSGDIFEMEDQRNWTDSAYKTFSTPLRLPYPVEVKRGTKIDQSITLNVSLDQQQTMVVPSPIDEEENTLIFSLEGGEQINTFPSIGLMIASHNIPLNDRELDRLSALNLNHLRVDLHLADERISDKLIRATSESSALNIPLEVGLHIGDDSPQDWTHLKHLLDRIKPNICRWLIYCIQEQFKGGTPIRQAVMLARKNLLSYGANIRFGAGTNTDLIFLQRTPPPQDLLDLVTFAINPQVHAFDNASIVENLEPQAAAVECARHIAGGLPVVVSPVTLKPRFNPYASAATPLSETKQLPPQVDVRQMSLLGAGWTVGSIKYLAQSGAESVTYYETTGWQGVMETEEGSPLKEIFRSLPGAVYPLYHVFADVGKFNAGQVISSKASDPLKIEGLAVSREDRTLILLANLTAERQNVKIRELSGRAIVRTMDENNMLEAMRFPEDFQASQGLEIKIDGEDLNLELLPYAVTRVHVM